MAYVASTPETQQIVVGASDFTVSLLGQTSDLISVEESLTGLEDKLSSIPGVGHVAVECSSCTIGSDAIASGETVLITFLSMKGDVAPMTLSDPTASVSEVVKGLAQPVVGRSTYWTIVKGLSSVNRWNVRVQAYNAIGGGVIEDSQQPEIQTFVQPPLDPREVSATRGSDANSLSVSWKEPLSDGGAAIDSFVIQYDTSPAFTSDGGQPVGHLIVGADDSSVVHDSVSEGGGSSSATTTTRTTVNIPGLSPGVEYYIRVAAANSAGDLQGPFSRPIAAPATPIDVPGAIPSVELTTMSSSELRVDWAPPLNIGSVPVESYVVEIALHDGNDDDDQSFDDANVVATEIISEATSEVQAIELTANEGEDLNSVGGYFTLSFLDLETVVISANESATDLKTKLQSLSHVRGSVEVERVVAVQMRTSTIRGNGSLLSLAE